MRRICAFVLVLSLICPVAASAGGADLDPDGLVAAGPAPADWIDALAQIFVVWIGV